MAARPFPTLPVEPREAGGMAPCSGRDTDARGGRAAWGPSGCAGAVPLYRAFRSAVVRLGGKAGGRRGSSCFSLTETRGRSPSAAHGSAPRGVGRRGGAASPREKARSGAGGGGSPLSEPRLLLALLRCPRRGRAGRVRTHGR